MVMEHDVPLKYLKTGVSTCTYDTGIVDWIGVDQKYRGASVRDKVICRLDMVTYLTKYFELNTVKEYREQLLMIAKGLITDANLLSQILTALIKEDEVFKESIHAMFYSCPIERAFGYHVMQCMADVINNTEAWYRSFFRGKPQVVICGSDGYLYFSVEDSNVTHSLPDDIKCEVVSYAKNWKGNFKVISGNV